MKEYPILFNRDMVKAILDGRKSMTRRVVKLQPNIIYSLTGDRISVILYIGNHTKPLEVTYVRDHIKKWHCFKRNSRLSQCGLQGGFGWQCLLPDKIQRLWEKGVRGLVSACWTQNKKGLLQYFNEPSKRKGNKECSSSDLHCVSRDAKSSITASSSPKRESLRQSSRESKMGDTGRKLDGQESSRQFNVGRETPDVETIRQGENTHSLVHCERNLQSTAYCESAWDVASGNIKCCPYKIGMTLWVRETWRTGSGLDEYSPRLTDEKSPFQYKSNMASVGGNYITKYNPWGRWRPSIHMPRKLSRIDLI